MTSAEEVAPAGDPDGNKLVVEVRTQFGKGFARRLRAAGKIPAVIYGHGIEPKHILLPGEKTALIVVGKANQVLDLQFDGKVEYALVKAVHKDPVHQVIDHLDLLVVRAGEQVTVDIPVHLEGVPAPDTNVTQDASTISLEVEATHIPENVTVSIDGFREGTRIRAGDVKLPMGATLVTDPEMLIVDILGGAQAEMGPSEVADPIAELRHGFAGTDEELETFLESARQVWMDEALENWLRGENPALEGARPIDVLRLRGPAEVLIALRAGLS